MIFNTRNDFFTWVALERKNWVCILSLPLFFLFFTIPVFAAPTGNPIVDGLIAEIQNLIDSLNNYFASNNLQYHVSLNFKCLSGYLQEFRCNGKYIQQKYQSSTCATSWKNKQYCTYGCSDNQCNPKPTTPIIPLPSSPSFTIQYLGASHPSDLAFGTSDGQTINYPTLANGTTLYSNNQVTIHANNNVEVVFAMKDFYPSLGVVALCPRSNVLDTDFNWQFSISKNGGIYTPYQSVMNPSWNSGYYQRGVYLGNMNAGDDWNIKFKGTIPNPCDGSWNLNTDSVYVFLIHR